VKASNTRPWRELLARVRGLDRAHARVGVFEGEIARIATIHEYGAPEAGIVERSWLRETLRRKHAELVALQGKLTRLVIAGRLAPRAAASLLGTWAAGAIKARITSEGDFAPLAPSTIAAKGSSRPLVDTGQLVGSITYVVVD